MPTSAQLLSVVKGSKLWILPKVRTAPTYEVLWLGVFWNSFLCMSKYVNAQMSTLVVRPLELHHSTRQRGGGLVITSPKQPGSEKRKPKTLGIGLGFQIHTVGWQSHRDITTGRFLHLHPWSGNLIPNPKTSATQLAATR